MSETETREGAADAGDAEAVAAAVTEDATTPPASPPATPHPQRTLWLTATATLLLAAGVVTGAGTAWQAFATDRTVAAHERVLASSEALSDVTDSLGAALDRARASLASIGSFTEHPRPDYLAATAADALTTAQNGLTSASAGLTYVPVDPPADSAVSAGLLPWEVIGDLEHKQKLIRQDDTDRRTRATELKALTTAQKTLETSAAAVYTALASHGEQLLTADASATYASKVELRHAIDGGKSGVMDSQFGGPGLVNLTGAIDGVNAAQAAGEAAKQDPAYPTRAEIEAYGRSIAHGVTLDFEWHEQVSGLGEGWYSGTTMYHEDDGGWATIDLNFELQKGWTYGDVNAKALVAHEVGHAQVVRPECKVLFDGPTFDRDDEMWATAWAIALGFDTGGAGIEAYGRPSDAQIAVAGQCT